MKLKNRYAWWGLSEVQSKKEMSITNISTKFKFWSPNMGTDMERTLVTCCKEVASDASKNCV